MSISPVSGVLSCVRLLDPKLLAVDAVLKADRSSMLPTHLLPREAKLLSKPQLMPSFSHGAPDKSHASYGRFHLELFKSLLKTLSCVCACAIPSRMHGSRHTHEYKTSCHWSSAGRDLSKPSATNADACKLRNVHASTFVRFPPVMGILQHPQQVEF